MATQQLLTGRNLRLVAFTDSKHGRWLRFARQIYEPLISRRKHAPGQFWRGLSEKDPSILQ